MITYIYIFVYILLLLLLLLRLPMIYFNPSHKRLEDELAEVVNLYMGKELKIYVYNLDSESIREVLLVPRTDWGGEGALGADIRTGLLHRIPAPRRAFGVEAPEPQPQTLETSG